MEGTRPDLTEQLDRVREEYDRIYSSQPERSMERRHFLRLSLLSSLLGCIGEGIVGPSPRAATGEAAGAGPTMEIFSREDEFRADYYDRAGRLIATYVSQEQLSAALSSKLGGMGMGENVNFVFVADQNGLRSSAPGTACSGQTCGQSQPLDQRFGDYHASMGIGSGYVGGCVGRAAPHVSIRLSYRPTGALLFDLHLCAWRDRSGRICVGLWESGPRHLVNWCTCPGWSSITSAFSAIRTKLYEVMLAVGVSAVIAAVAADVLAGGALVLLPVGL